MSEVQNKGQNLFRRAGFAVQGVLATVRYERSFRTQFVAALAVVVSLIWLQPGWLWSALLLVCCGLVLSLELVNTALEHALDGLHPEHAEFVRLAKDAAAGAVLVASLFSVACFVMMLADLR